MTVGEDFPKQQDRLRRCLRRGLEIGPAGRVYVIVADDLLRRADEAAISGDLSRILVVYQEMKEFKE